jgi:hypothetical protein
LRFAAASRSRAARPVRCAVRAEVADRAGEGASLAARAPAGAVGVACVAAVGAAVVTGAGVAVT